MSKHTPGPWKAYESSERCPFPVGIPIEVGTEEGCGKKTGTVCEMVGQGNGKYDPVVTSANARLIAAAPDLLEVCHDMLGWLESLEIGLEITDPLRRIRQRFHAPHRAKLEAAIKKADGE